MKNPIVILHGWGASSSSFIEVKKLLEEKDYSVFVPDLPGFGSNKNIKKDLVFEDYLEFVNLYILDLLKKNKKNKIVLIGHSFGGRIAIRFLQLYPQLVSALILTGASGIPRSLPSFKKRVVYKITKILRPLFEIPPFSFFYKLFRKIVYYSIGEMDYYKAGNLSNTFKNVYQVSIVDSLSSIHIPTLLVWGGNDRITPLVDGELMHEKIKDSVLVVVDGASHKLPYELAPKFVDIVIKFLQKK